MKKKNPAATPAPETIEEVKETQKEPIEAAAGEDGGAPAEDMVLTPEQQIELREKFAALQKERDDMLQTAQRVQAEFDNFRRRNAAARADALAEGSQNAIKALLAAYDSLQLAVENAAGDDSPLAQGVALVHKQFDDALKKLGVETLDPIGQTFDPNFHNAIMKEDAAEGVEANTITMVLQKGYVMDGKVLREALVKVAV